MAIILTNKRSLKNKIAELNIKVTSLEAEAALLNERLYILNQFRKIAAELMIKTGWSYNQAEKHFEAAYRKTGCTAKEYMLYKFYELSEKQQMEYFLISMQAKIRQKYDVSKKFVGIICDKAKTNEYFSECVKRPWCVNTEVRFEQFAKIFNNVKKIIYKPVDGHCGYGAKAFVLDSQSMRTVYDELIGMPRGVVEELIVQHSAMASLCPTSVNTLRFVTFSSNRNPVTADGKFVDIAYAIVRIGRNGSVVDNFHNGGLVASVDLTTNTLLTNGVDQKGNVFAKHPDTGVTIKGFQIPYVEEAKKMVLDAIEEKKVKGYLGWDIAITEDGPQLIEVNTCPSAECLQAPFAEEKIGMKRIMEKYL